MILKNMIGQKYFKEYDWSKVFKLVNGNYLFDTKNILDKNKINKIGFKLITLGRKI